MPEETIACRRAPGRWVLLRDTDPKEIAVHVEKADH